jgi:putative tricarboxylic transport membrane protein
MADRIISILILIFSVCYIVATMRLPNPPASTLIGPKDFPFFVGISLSLSSLALFLKSFKERGKTDQSIARKENIIFVTLAIIGYISMLRFTGYIVSTFIFLLIVLLVLNKKKVYLNIGIAVVSAVVAYFLIKTLQISLPDGIFGFP